MRVCVCCARIKYRQTLEHQHEWMHVRYVLAALFDMRACAMPPRKSRCIGRGIPTRSTAITWYGAHGVGVARDAIALLRYICDSCASDNRDVARGATRVTAMVGVVACQRAAVARAPPLGMHSELNPTDTNGDVDTVDTFLAAPLAITYRIQSNRRSRRCMSCWSAWRTRMRVWRCADAICTQSCSWCDERDCLMTPVHHGSTTARKKQ